MVWDDPFRDPVGSTSSLAAGSKNGINQANCNGALQEVLSQRIHWLSTRGLAASIDLFVYYTLVRFFLTPWRAQVNSLWFEMTANPSPAGEVWFQWLQSIVLLVALGGLLGIFLWSLTIKLVGQSPGQKIMRLLIVVDPLQTNLKGHDLPHLLSHSKQIPSLFALMVRAFGFFVALLLLGLPYLSILFSPRATVFYERWSGSLTWSHSLSSATTNWWGTNLYQLPQFFWIKWYQRLGISIMLIIWLSLTYQILNPWLYQNKRLVKNNTLETQDMLTSIEASSCKFQPANWAELEKASLRWLATIEPATPDSKHARTEDSLVPETEKDCIEQILIRYRASQPQQDALLLFMRWWLWSDDPQAQGFIQKDCDIKKNNPATRLFCEWKDLWLLKPQRLSSFRPSADDSLSPVEAFLRMRYHWFYHEDEWAQKWFRVWVNIDPEISAFWHFKLSWSMQWAEQFKKEESVKFIQVVSNMLPAKDRVEWLTGICDRALSKACADPAVAASCTWQKDQELWRESLALGELQAYLRFYHTYLCQMKKRPDWWEQAWFKLPRWKKEKIKPAMLLRTQISNPKELKPASQRARFPAKQADEEINAARPVHYLDWWVQHVILQDKE